MNHLHAALNSIAESLRQQCAALDLTALMRPGVAYETPIEPPEKQSMNIEAKTIPPLVTDHLTAQFVVATKPLIDGLLALNTRNRKLMGSAVSRLKNDILDGAYLATCQGIGVDRHGVLADGQHRLVAIKEAGYPPVVILLVTGLDPNAQAVIDRGAKRSLADALALVEGRTVSNAVVAACSIFITIKNAHNKSVDFGHVDRACRALGRIKAAVRQWEDDVSAILSVVGSFRAAVVAALAVYHRHEPEAALAFATKLRTGVNLSADDPALRLREALHRGHSGGAAANMRVFKLSVTACIADANKKQLKLIKERDSWSEAPWRPWLASA